MQIEAAVRLYRENIEKEKRAHFNHDLFIKVVH